MARAREGKKMAWDWPVRGFDALERIKTIAKWFGLDGWLLMVAGVAWTWLCGVPLWWWLPAVLAIVGAVLFFKGSLAFWEAKRLARDQERLAATLGPALVEVVRAVVQHEKSGPTHRVLKADVGRFEVMGKPADLKVEPEFVSLRDAMIQAYEATQEGVLGPFARGLTKNPDDALDWLAVFSVKHIPIYGKSPPGTDLHQISPRTIGRLNFVGGAQCLEAPYSNHHEFTELSVKRADLADYLAKIAEIDAQFAFELGYEQG
jgi:hypothetical protein